MVTSSQKLSDWIWRLNGFDESLIERDGYLQFRSWKAGRNWCAVFVLPVVGAAGFAFSWFTREEPFAFWLGIFFGVIAMVVIPILMGISSRKEQHTVIEIENGVIRWESKQPFLKDQIGHIELDGFVDVDLEFDHEGQVSEMVFLKTDGEQHILPRQMTQLMMARCRKPFLKTVRHYEPDLFPELKSIFNAKPHGCT